MGHGADTKPTDLARATCAVEQTMLDRFREIAEKEDRTVSQELRRLIRARVAEAEEIAA